MQPQANKRQAIQEHILSYFTKDHGWDSDAPLNNLKSQVQYMQHRHTDNVYDIGVHMASGGTFLVYHQDVIKFLNTVGYAFTSDDTDKAWKTYVHNIGREVATLVGTK